MLTLERWRQARRANLSSQSEPRENSREMPSDLHTSTTAHVCPHAHAHMIHTLIMIFLKSQDSYGALMTQDSAARHRYISHSILFGINFWLYIQKSYTVPFFYDSTFHYAMHN